MRKGLPAVLKRAYYEFEDYLEVQTAAPSLWSRDLERKNGNDAPPAMSRIRPPARTAFRPRTLLIPALQQIIS